MTDIRVHRLPKTTDPVLLETQSRPMRLARLKSLQSDPKSFSSKYEDEVIQPLEFWLNRLRPEDCQHFVAATSSWNDVNDFKDVQFKGFMVVLAPSAPTEEHNMPTYVVAAFWLDPEVRGQKIGSKMIEESVQWMREDASRNGWKQIRYQLDVKPDNYRAINLYNRLGFSPVSKDSEEDTSADNHMSRMDMIIDTS